MDFWKLWNCVVLAVLKAKFVFVFWVCAAYKTCTKKKYKSRHSICARVHVQRINFQCVFQIVCSSYVVTDETINNIRSQYVPSVPVDLTSVTSVKYIVSLWTSGAFHIYENKFLNVIFVWPFSKNNTSYCCPHVFRKHLLGLLIDNHIGKGEQNQTNNVNELHSYMHTVHIVRM